MAAASNFMLGQTDFQRRLYSNSSLIDTSNVRLSTNPNLLRNYNSDIKIDHGNSKLVRASNRGNFAGVLDNPSPEKITIAVDVDEDMNMVNGTRAEGKAK